ncbi:MAG: phosphatase PAP2 family protein [Clostridia bacterium]|jgi:membrane-associated phospholipid phosphatase|nr:phosphatase PAP2 family protein [Clostridia bacterium]NLS84892.1 phosphatase PAP2 family protein [Oscillospiraceae bacterium]
MDISYLLLLQNFREVTNNIFTPFFEFMSELVVTAPFYIAIAVIYWSISKRTGTMLLFNFAVGGLLNQLVKNTCCVYRPWIRDARVLPAGDSLTTATGYSFPSGHTQRATAIFETTAIWQKKRRWLAALLILALITVGFARNYLGVHTPQDVFVSFFLCSLVIFANSKILPWAEKKQGRDLILLAAGAVRAVMGIIPLCLLLTYAPAPLYAALGNHWGRFTMWLIFYSYLTAIYPLCIMLVQKRAFCKQSI